MSEGLTLSKEQAAILLPLLPTALAHSSKETTSSAGDAAEYSIEEMLKKKKRNGKSTPAQNYLLVSSMYIWLTTLAHVLCHYNSKHSFYGILSY